jgi:hypothetical protein
MTDLQLEVSQHTSFCQLLLFFLSSIACKKTSKEEKAEITVNAPQSVARCELSSATVPADDFAVVLGRGVRQTSGCFLSFEALEEKSRSGKSHGRLGEAARVWETPGGRVNHVESRVLQMEARYSVGTRVPVP